MDLSRVWDTDRKPRNGATDKKSWTEGRSYRY